MRPSDSTRAATPVVGVVLLVAVVVLLAAVVSVFVLGMGENVQQTSPTISVTYTLVDDGPEQTVAITHVGGDSVEASHLTVVGSADLDVGGPPGSPTPADQQWASSRERFDEGSDQVDVGDTWDSGETVHVDPKGSVNDVRIQFTWASQPVRGVNPGSQEGRQSYVIAEVVVGE